MAVHLYVAPAAGGKTEASIAWVRAATHGRPLAPVWAVLPNRAQVHAFRRRLAAAGGALGVEVATFFTLYHETLRAAGQVLAELGEPLQHRLLRAVVDQAVVAGRLQHYAPLAAKPGFVRALHHLIEELKQARVQPAQLEAALQGQGARLEELAGLYSDYQRRLRAGQWMDAEGLGWLATSALARSQTLLSGWGLVVVDGFDQFNQTQVAFLAELARHVPELRITLTWSMGAERLVHCRFAQALERLQTGLKVQAEMLDGAHGRRDGPAAAFEVGLFEPAKGSSPHYEGAQTGVAPLRSGGLSRSSSATGVALVEAPNRAIEVRAALRWAKERVLGDGYAPGEVAILARDLAPYAPFLAEIAAEFGLPLALAGGRPLAGNPAVAALMGLLSLARRDRASASLPDGRFPLRPVLQALRSPYFDWGACLAAGEPLGLTPEDADRLERAAQAAQVLGGLDEWRDALAQLAQAAGDVADEDGEPAPAYRDGSWAGLATRFERLVARLTPAAEGTVAGYTAFVEGLIGDDPGSDGTPDDGDPESLRMPECVRSGPPNLVARDIAALRGLKDALRGLVWAESALGGGAALTYERFLDELEGVVAASQYEPEAEADGALWASSAHDARGLTFRAVALLGLAEGVFPKAPAGDPLLRPNDRERLAAQGLRLEPQPPGAEFTLFYEAATRARERLLLTRPYLAEDGQPWEPSPFWDEARRLCGGVAPTRVHAAGTEAVERAASWPEALVVAARLVARGGPGAALASALASSAEAADGWQAARHGAQVLAARLERTPAGPFEGDCSALAPALTARYAPARPWSASRLESYLCCPLGFFLRHALELPERAAPAVGYDAAQLGTMYHEILEAVYRSAASCTLEDLAVALPRAAEAVLAGAPRRLGFRPSRLWHQERARMVADVENTLRGLAACSEGWQPAGLELRFGLPGENTPPQRIAAPEGGEFLLRGVIDRVDRDGAGCLRLLDYKTTGEAITPADLLEGRRIQLALYAWAAQGVLGLGTVAGGFYWHLRQAKRSSLTLQGMAGGAAAAMTLAAEHAGRAIAGARVGAFAPAPAGRGCPAYCVGNEFCWRYEAK